MKDRALRCGGVVQSVDRIGGLGDRLLLLPLTLPQFPHESALLEIGLRDERPANTLPRYCMVSMYYRDVIMSSASPPSATAHAIFNFSTTARSLGHVSPFSYY
jgi:hypothetical protein